jgi:hypothetical protein
MKNRYKEGTKKYQIAEALLAGEVDMGKVAKVVDVSLTTIYNTASNLTRLGIPLAIHQIPQVATTSTTLPTISTQPTTSTHQQPPPVNSTSNLESRQLDNQLTGGGGGVAESRPTQLTSESHQTTTTTPVSSNNSPVSSPGGPTHPMATGEIDQVAQRLYEIMQGKSPQERSEGYR